MEITAGAVVVAVIAGVANVIVALVTARSTRNAVLAKLELQQAVQNERVESYQRTTNEKIDRLTEQVTSQAAFGTRIALLESWKEQVERRGTL